MPKKLSGIFLISCLFLGAFTPMAEADSVLRSGEAVSIAEDQIVEGDFYAAGSKVSISGELKEDLVAAGGQVTVNGPVGADAFIVGGGVDVHGTVGDDLRIIAGEVTLAEPVMGDILVIGGSVTILSTASVAGDVIVFAGDVVIEGSVGGDVIGTVGSLRVDAPVAGDIDITTNTLTLGDNAQVAGSVLYTSDIVLTQALNASVTGDTVRNDPLITKDNSGDWKTLLIVALVFLFSVLVWYLLSRQTLQWVVNRAVNRSVRSLLIGFSILILVPIGASVLLVSTIGSLVGLILFTLYLLILTLGLVGSMAVFGSVIYTHLFSNKKPIKLVISPLTLILGVFAFMAALLVPFVGLLIITLGFLTTCGAIAETLFRPGAR